jgi:prophage regulatory protein
MMESEMKFVRFPDLKATYGVGFSKVHIARLEAVGRFPRRVTVSPNCVAWIAEEIQSWQAARAAARFAPKVEEAEAREAEAAKPEVREGPETEVARPGARLAPATSTGAGP